MEDNKKILEKYYIDKENIQDNKEENIKKVEYLKSYEYVQTEEEKELYEKFKEIAKADPDNKFKFKHLKDLGVNFDFCVIYGKKGIGKTFQINKLITELAEKDPLAQIILLRNTVSEFKALEKQLNYEENSSIFIKGTSTNNPTLWHKEFIDKNEKPRYMGFCVALNGSALEASKGAEYRNVRLIIWDECTNMGAGNSYNSSDIYRFVTFFDSIIRNKTNVDIYIFGNFHRTTSGKVSDVLLDTLKIPYGCTLKKRSVLSKDKKNQTTFLYVNTGDLYSGVDTNSKVSLFNEEIQDDLYSNIPQSHSDMVGGINLFYNNDPEWGLLFNDGIDTYILFLSSSKIEKNENEILLNWMIHMEKFPPNAPFTHDLITSDIALYNEYRKYSIKLISKQEEILKIHDLYEYCLNRSLHYSNDITRELFRHAMSRWQEKHNLGISISFWRQKRKKKQGF